MWIQIFMFGFNARSKLSALVGKSTGTEGTRSWREKGVAENFVGVGDSMLAIMLGCAANYGPTV
jgi:hypothetical protein